MINPCMSEEHPAPPSPRLGRARLPPPARRERWTAAAIVLLVVLIRSLVFVFWEQSAALERKCPCPTRFLVERSTFGADVMGFPEDARP